MLSPRFAGRSYCRDFLSVCYHPDDTCSLVYLATAHLDDNPIITTSGNLGACCQWCNIIHDRPERLRRRRLALLMSQALGDLFDGQYQTL
jgi:hypothetical protein